MQNQKIAFVVGHANWGKSRTLKALTNENVRVKKTTISNTEFFIRRMSNDDQPEGYVKFMKSLNPTTRPYLIAALCPQFDNPAAHTISILTDLKAKGYQLFFWVIEHQYGTSEVVNANEIQQLSKFGTIEVFSNTANASSRSNNFQQFVINVVLA